MAQPSKAQILEESAPREPIPEGVRKRLQEIANRFSTILKAWDPSLHPRSPAGSSEGGQFTKGFAASIAKSLYEKALAAGGFTYDVIHRIFPRTGFVVSTNPEAEEVKQGKVTPDDIRQYATRHREILKQPGMKLGAWFDKQADKWYLDVVHVTKDKDEAIRLAREHKQEGIFDLKSKTTIITKPKKDRRL